MSKITERRCENWLRRTIAERLDWTRTKGIEVNCFWRMAEQDHVYEPGTYGDRCPMSKVLPKYVKDIEDIRDKDGNYLFSAFRFI